MGELVEKAIEATWQVAGAIDGGAAPAPTLLIDRTRGQPAARGECLNAETFPRSGLSRRSMLAGLAATSVAGLIAGCQANPHLGREQLIMVSDAELRQLGRQTWTTIRNRFPRDDEATRRRQVAYVGRRVVDASGQVNEDWEFDVFQGPANAFVLPGGKVGFFTGIFPHMENEAQVATVMGHEAGHVAARHQAERISQHLLASIVVGAVTAVLAGRLNNRTEVQLVAGLLGAGITYGVLMPYSREHEHEADRLGTRFMATAGYDPRESTKFWRSMAAQGSRGRPPEFLSTHPSDEARIAQLEAQMPEAVLAYERSGKAEPTPANWSTESAPAKPVERVLCRLGNARPVSLSAEACRGNGGLVMQ